MNKKIHVESDDLEWLYSPDWEYFDYGQYKRHLQMIIIWRWRRNRMKIIEYFTTENKEHWLNEIGKSDWGAGQYLHQLLRENNLKRMVGETALVPMLVEGDKLIAFCTFAPLDDIQPTDMSPWIGFAYTFPQVIPACMRNMDMNSLKWIRT